MLRIVTLAMLVAVPTMAAPPVPTLEAKAQLLRLLDERRYEEALLRELAAHPEAAVRERAGRVAGGLAQPGALAILRRLATDATPAVRAAAAEAAGRLAADLGAASKGGKEAATLLRRLLRDARPEVRRAAAWGIAAGGFEDAGRWLLRHLASEADGSTRATCLGELWRVAADEGIPVAAAALGDRSPEVRYAAAWSLARSTGAGAEDALRRAAASADPAVRALAMEGIRRRAERGLLPLLWPAVEDPEATVREAALGAAAAVAEKIGSLNVPAEVAARVASLVAHADPQHVHERIAAVRLAGQARLATEALEACVAAGDAWVAEEALVALARQGAPAARSLAETFRSAPEVARRAAAARALALLPGGPASLAWAASDPAPAVRLALVDAAAAMAGEVGTELLGELVADADGAVRAAAVAALAERGALPERGRLLALLAHERGTDARVAIVEALAAAGTPAEREVQLFLRLLGGEDPVVARAAWAALRRHGRLRPLPPVATGWELARYREVAAWAEQPRFLEVVTVRGTMAVALDAEHAPLAAYRLAELAASGFFDGLTVHRVVPTFVVQGGDPRGDGWGGPAFTLRHELCLAPYDAGTVGLAHAGPDTAGSQFFVTLTPQLHLVGRYPVVGRVSAGLDVASRLRVGDRILRVRVAETAPHVFPVWYGVLDPARLDAEIQGWAVERQGYTPREDILALLRTARLRYGLTVAMGTWCSDSREQIPHLQAILDALGEASPFAPPLLLGSDRAKAYPPDRFPYGAVERVPTIVVTFEGQEIGRIVETPSSGSLEEDLATILAPLEGWEAPSL